MNGLTIAVIYGLSWVSQTLIKLDAMFVKPYILNIILNRLDDGGVSGLKRSLVPSFVHFYRLVSKFSTNVNIFCWVA